MLDLDGSKDEDSSDGEEIAEENLSDLIERLKTTRGSGRDSANQSTLDRFTCMFSCI